MIEEWGEIKSRMVDEKNTEKNWHKDKVGNIDIGVFAIHSISSMYATYLLSSVIWVNCKISAKQVKCIEYNHVLTAMSIMLSDDEWVLWILQYAGQWIRTLDSWNMKVLYTTHAWNTLLCHYESRSDEGERFDQWQPLVLLDHIVVLDRSACHPYVDLIK